MSDCSCIYVDHSSDTIKTLTYEKRVSRKMHTCSECGNDIAVGQTYEYFYGVLDGKFYTYRTCVDCLSVQDSFFCEGRVFEGTWIMIDEHIEEMGGQISSDCLVPLTKLARDKVCDMIEQYWDDWEDDDE